MKRRTYWEIVENALCMCNGTCRQSEVAAYNAVAREAVSRYKMKHGKGQGKVDLRQLPEAVFVNGIRYERVK